MFDQFVQFCQESYHELRLSSWLSTQQMAASTVIVIILTIIVSAYVSLIDQGLLAVAKYLFGIG